MAKSDTWPTDEERAQGFEFPEPYRDALSDHVATNAQFVVTSRSRRGEYFADVLNLNGAVHQHRRRERSVAQTFLQTCTTALDQLREAGRPEEIARLETQLDRVRTALGLTGPWDEPGTCRCSTSLKAT
jgi:hypothetical protein